MEINGLFFDVGGTVFDWKNTALEKIQELADAKAPEEDNIPESFGQPGRADFDVEAKDFEDLCQKLGV